MQFYISPSAGHANVEVCVLPVPRAQEDEEFTIDDIKTRGSCTHEMDANGQYFLSFELEPASYTALIYAHSDSSFVSIPVLSPLLQGNRYAFQFTMQSCDNRRGSRTPTRTRSPSATAMCGPERSLRASWSTTRAICPSR